MNHPEETPTSPLGEPAGGPSGEEPTEQLVPPAADETPVAGTPAPPAPPPPPHSFSAWGGYPGSAPGGPPYWAPPAPPPPAHSGPRFGGHFLVLIALVALLAGGLGAALDAVFATNNSNPSSFGPPNSVATLPGSQTAPLSANAKSVAAVADAVDPAIVDINTAVLSQVGIGSETGAGTGMIVTRSGEVLTNNHVVEDASSIKVTIERHSGQYDAEVIGVDPTQDVALIQIINPPSNLPYVHLGDSSTVKVGTSVVAIGNAMGLGGRPTVTSGTITAVNRTITAGDQLSPTATETLHNLFQTDAPIEAGDSGGPLLNLRGQVVAMDTAASSSANGSLGFAIPINFAHTIALAMEHGQASSRIVLGETAFLGVCEACATSYFFPNSGAGTPANGVSIEGVISGSPAENAGLTGGDTITDVDGTPTNSYVQLQNAIRAHKPGNSVTVTYIDANGATHTVSVTLSGIPL
jgi:S1-C subfamily serine protease